MSWGTESQKKPTEEELERFEELKKVPSPPLPPMRMGSPSYASTRGEDKYELRLEVFAREGNSRAGTNRRRTYLVIAVVILFLVVAAVGAFFIWRSL